MQTIYAWERLDTARSTLLPPLLASAWQAGQAYWRLQESPISPYSNYLVKARNFGLLPFQFSKEPPALIWNLSLPAWPQI